MSRGATMFVLFPTLYSVYKNDRPQTPGVCLGLLGDDTCIYTTDRKDGYLSDNCSVFSVLLRCGVGPGT
jgi:hypothetical protein